MVGRSCASPEGAIERAGRTNRRARALVIVGLAVGLASALCPSASAERVRVDGIAAIVGGTAPRTGTVVLYASDVELDAWLERARRHPDGLISDERLTPAELTAARERLVGAALLALEASRLRLDDLGEAQLAAAWRRFFERHGGARVIEGVVARLGLGNDELERYVRRQGVARAFILASSEQGGLVTDAELEDAFARGEHPYVGMDLDTVREAFRAFLLERRIEDETLRWTERLRLRVPVGGGSTAR